MNWRTGLILSTFLGAASAHSSNAFVPAQYLIDGVDQGVPGTYPVTTGNGGSIVFTASPIASVQVTANGTPDFSLNSPTADLRYFFQFTDAGGTPNPIPLLINTTMFVSFFEPEGGSGNDFPIARATLKINESDNGVTALQQVVDVFGSGTNFFSGILSAAILSNTIYQIDLTAHVITLGQEHGFASIDPQLFLDPAQIDPNAFTLQLSDGIGNDTAAPEPGSLGLVTLAAAGFYLFRRRA